MKKSMKRVLLVSTGLTLAFPVAGQAQQSAEIKLDEIIVTARKVEESLQDAPLSVTAFTADDLASAGIQDIADLSFLTPGFSMQDNSRVNSQPFIRGMSVNSFFRPVQTTSSFIDGMFVQGLGRTVDFEAEVERVEVVKGPQSALYGKSTFAGAINYITKPVNYDEVDGTVLATAGENGLYEGSLNINVPLVPGKVAARVNLQGMTYESEFEDASSGDDIGGRETLGASLKMGALFTENLEATFRISYTEFNDEHSANVCVCADQLNFNAGGTYDLINGVIPIPSRDSIDINTENVDGGYRTSEQFRAHLVLDYQFGDGYALTSLTHYSDELFDYYIDGDLTNTSAFGGLFESRFDEAFEDIGQELRIVSPQDEPFRWLAGVNYYTSEYIIGQLASNVVPGSPRREQNYSVFGSMSYDLTDSLTATFDARFQSERIRRQFPLTDVTQYKVTTDTFLPRVILEFEPTDGNRFYASVSRGNQPADFNTGAGTPEEFINIDEQKMWNYEIGTKNSFADNRFRLNAAAFYIDWTGQLSRFVTIGTTGSTVNLNINAGKSEIKGIEVEGEAAITEGWTAKATFAYVDAEYKDFNSQNCERAFGNDGTCDPAKIQNTPEIQFSLSSTYNFPITDTIDGFIRGDLSYRGEQFVDEINVAKAPSATLLNLRTGINYQGAQVAFWVKNLTNEDSPAFATRFLDLTVFPFNTGYQLNLRPGREIGGTVRYSF